MPPAGFLDEGVLPSLPGGHHVPVPADKVKIGLASRWRGSRDRKADNLHDVTVAPKMTQEAPVRPATAIGYARLLHMIATRRGSRRPAFLRATPASARRQDGPAHMDPDHSGTSSPQTPQLARDMDSVWASRFVGGWLERHLGSAASYGAAGGNGVLGRSKDKNDRNSS